MRTGTILLAALLMIAGVGSCLQAQIAELRDGRFVNVLQTDGGYLGVAIVDVDSDRVSRLKLQEARGVEVTNTQEGSPADTAGVKPGDVFLTYNGEVILGARQFVRLVRETPAGRRVRISLWRNGREQSLVVTTASPRLFAQGRSPADMSASNGLPSEQGVADMRALVMPDIPIIIMVWNSSALGIECEPINAQLAQYFGVKQGVLVRSVQKGTAAEKAGLKAGDVLTSIGNQPVRTPEEFRRSVRAGTKSLGISLVRDRKELTLNLSPATDREQ